VDSNYIGKAWKSRESFEPDPAWESVSWLTNWPDDPDAEPPAPVKAAQPACDAIPANCSSCQCPVHWETHSGALACWKCQPPPVLPFVSRAFIAGRLADSRQVWMEATDAVLACIRQIRKSNPGITKAGEVFEVVKYCQKAATLVANPIIVD
jgi:hypothetical protein